MTLGQRIQTLRKERGVTQNQLARAVGVSKPAVSKWENGASMPDVGLLSPIARFLRTDLNDLLQFKENIRDQEVMAYMERMETVFSDQGFQEGYEAVCSLVAEYPDNNYLKLCGARLVVNQAESRAISYHLETCRDWLKHIVTYPSDQDQGLVKPAALSILIRVYEDLGQLEEVEDLLCIPERPFDPSLLLSRVYLMQDKVDQAYEIFISELNRSMSTVLANLQGLYELGVKEGQLDKAKIYAEDFKEISKLFAIEPWKPSDLVLDLALLENDYDQALLHLQALVKELKRGPSKLYQGPKKQVYWSTSGHETQEAILRHNLREKPHAQDFIKGPQVRLILDQLKDT